MATPLSGTKAGARKSAPSFASCFGLPAPRLDNVRVGPTPPTVVLYPDWQQEVALDTELVAAMALKLSALDVVDGSVASASSVIDLLDAPLDDKLFNGPAPKVVFMLLKSRVLAPAVPAPTAANRPAGGSSRQCLKRVTFPATLRPMPSRPERCCGPCQLAPPPRPWCRTKQ